MKVDIKLYKAFDADLISLNANGISISAMIKEALRRFCRGEIARFYIPECKPFELAGLKHHIHVVAIIKDEASINFLKKEIKPRERSAFIRTLLRECLMTQQLGVYLKNSSMIQKETERYQALDLESYDNVYALSFQKRKHDYASEILLPAGEKPKKKQRKEKVANKSNTTNAGVKSKTNRFGDVSDLALANNKKIELEETSKGSGKRPTRKTIEELDKGFDDEQPISPTKTSIASNISNIEEVSVEKMKPENIKSDEKLDSKEPWDDAEDIAPLPADHEDMNKSLSMFDSFLDAFDD